MGSIREQIRPPCPFYGFGAEGKYLMDMRQNNCALTMPMVRHCAMEIFGLVPDRSICPVFKMGEKRSKEIFWDYLVFPDEIQPGDGRLAGVPFEIWEDIITSGRFHPHAANS